MFRTRLMHITSLLSFVLVTSLYPQEVPATVPVDSLPKPKAHTENTWISDPAHQLLEREVPLLNASLSRLSEKTSGVEMVVVLLPSLGEGGPKDYAVQLFQRWGIGKKGKDNGLLLLLVQDLKRWELEVGYGLEGDLPDITVKRLADRWLVPFLMEGQPAQGVDSLVRAIEAVLTQSNPSPTEIPARSPEERAFANGTNDGSWEKWNLEEAVRLARQQLSAEEGAPLLMPTAHREKQVHAWGLTGFDLFEALRTVRGLMAVTVLTLLIALGFVVSGRLKAIFLGVWVPFILGEGSLWFAFQSAEPTQVFLLGYGIGGGLATLGIALLGAKARSTQDDFVGRYHRIEQAAQQGVFLYLLYPFLIPLLLLWRARSLRAIRQAPRTCLQCRESMRRLEETEEDAYLSAGQQAEERSQSIDHDAWVCPQRHLQIYSFDQKKSGYTPCPVCGFKTWHIKRRDIIVKATESEEGQGIHHYLCAHCQKEESRQVVLPRVDSSSSSVMSGGSSGGSGFGGGRSGGGGAGGNW